MLFNSWGYLLFLLIAVVIHWFLPQRFRIGLLGLLSILFYGMWRWEFAILIAFSTLVDYLSAQRIHASKNEKVRRKWLFLSLFVNIGLLVVFKYAYFLSDNAVGLLQGLGYDGNGLRGLGIEIILPLGISFYTFQTISYTIDVYRKVIKPERDFIYFFTYVTFWPQLVAGPILRASEVLPQLKSRRRFDWNDISKGIFQIFIGLFKKIVIADSLGILVDSAFSSDIQSFTAFDVWVAAILFGFQIYYDFSGYSDIAIGSARLLGIRFPKNFNWPYLATSPRDFWSRWHISLSSWIRDYLYIPLTGGKFQSRSDGGLSIATESRNSNLIVALFATWFIMGLWHGASWNFAIWGVYHAVLVLIYRFFRPLQSLSERLPLLGWMIVFPLLMAGWIPFRTQNISDAFILFAKIVNPFAYTMSDRVLIGHSYLAVMFLLLTMIIFAFFRKVAVKEILPLFLQSLTKGLVISLITLTLVTLHQPIKQFIYFQF